MYTHNMTDEPKQPGDELRIALAGPVTSLIIGGICWGIYFWSRGSLVFLSAGK